ncbi:hypothetical protein EDB87DRAFT_1580587 [Lactarius vividus]|nr:hypothetical protein EDB87DRAFT_1580587 [Lactarius vividus]
MVNDHSSLKSEGKIPEVAPGSVRTSPRELSPRGAILVHQLGHLDPVIHAVDLRHTRVYIDARGCVIPVPVAVTLGHFDAYALTQAQRDNGISTGNIRDYDRLCRNDPSVTIFLIATSERMEYEVTLLRFNIITRTVKPFFGKYSYSVPINVPANDRAEGPSRGVRHDSVVMSHLILLTRWPSPRQNGTPDRGAESRLGPRPQSIRGINLARQARGESSPVGLDRVDQEQESAFNVASTRSFKVQGGKHNARQLPSKV